MSTCLFAITTYGFSLARKTAIVTSNSKSVLTHSQTLFTETQTLATQLDNFVKSSSQSLAKLRADAEQHQVKELESLSSCSGRISEQMQRVQDAFQVIQAKDEASSEAVNVIHSAVKQAHDNIRSGFTSWSEQFKLSTASMCSEVEKASLHGYQTVCLQSYASCFSP